MPLLIALTTGYAQCVPGGYFLLPIFAKMTILAIFGPAGDFRDFGGSPPQNRGFWPIFGHFWGILAIFGQNRAFSRKMLGGAVFSKNRTLWHERKSIFRVIGFF